MSSPSNQSPSFTAAPSVPDPVRAVFFDIDDTFYSHRLDQTPPAYLELVRSLRSRGIKCALSTARSLELAENLLGPQKGLWDGMVAGNGAFVYDENFEILFEKPFSEETLGQLLEAGRKAGAGFFVSGTNAFVFEHPEHVQPKLDSNHIQGLPVRQPDENDRLSVMSICHPDPESMRQDLENIDGLFVHYTKYSADVSRSDLSKYEGISMLMKHWGLEAHDYAAFGDSKNDLEMLENAKVAVAMHESEPVVLERFENQAPPVEEGGIAAWMKKEGWIA